MESVKVVSIRGISSTDAAKLAAAGVSNSLELLNRGATATKLAELSKTTGIAQARLKHAVQQADLLRIPGISVDDADSLVRAGITSVLQLATAEAADVRRLITEYRQANPKPSYELPTPGELVAWIGVAKTIAPVLRTTTATSKVAMGSADNEKDTLSVEMSEFVVQLGAGIARAQQALDENSIETQKAINSDERLRSLGLQATWYAIPEATLALKMEYSMTKESSQEGGRALRLNPINAKYRNYFSSTESTHSELNLKFCAVPPPQRFTQSVLVPSLVGSSIDHASQVLDGLGLQIGALTVVEGSLAEGLASEVVSQRPAAGTPARFMDQVDVAIVKRKE
jgi:predicted flap endonuclease-1-like 5' DNA nuclease